MTPRGTLAWELPPELANGGCTVAVPPFLCAAGGLLFGGWALALAVDAAQVWSGHAARDVSMHYLAPVRVGESLQLTVVSARRGRTLSHVRVAAAVAGRPAFDAQVVVGAAPTDEVHAWAMMPDVLPPGECPSRTYRFDTPGSARDSMDIRLAAPEPVPGGDSAGGALLWARVLAETSPAGRSAVLSDHIPYVVVRSLADVRHATTVSATLRILGEPHGEWTLLDVELAGTDGAYCVGRVREWAADGRLVAVADQTAYTRFA